MQLDSSQEVVLCDDHDDTNEESCAEYELGITEEFIRPEGLETSTNALHEPSSSASLSSSPSFLQTSKKCNFYKGKKTKKSSEDITAVDSSATLLAAQKILSDISKSRQKRRESEGEKVQSPTKQIAKKGDKRVGAVVAQERGTLVTVCCGISASGNHIPPFLIFPRVNAQNHWRMMLPPGSLVEGHPKAIGWITRENFLSYLKHFVKHTKPTEDSPVLLLDNHQSYISLDAINYCREHHVTMLSFPPHCSHELQPLDKTVYGPFKTFCNQAADRWCHDATNRSKPMTIHTLPSIVNYGFTHAFSQKNILSGFKSTGIYPFDRNVIPEDRYLPSYTTDRPLLKLKAMQAAAHQLCPLR